MNVDFNQGYIYAHIFIMSYTTTGLWESLHSLHQEELEGCKNQKRNNGNFSCLVFQKI